MPKELTVTDVVAAFSDCLRALTSYVVMVGIEWEEGKSYDDWDAIADTLYTTIVDNTIAYPFQGQDFEKLTLYALVRTDYFNKSYLYDVELGRHAPFLKLERSDLPFDTAVFVRIDDNGRPLEGPFRKRLRDCQLVALLWSPSAQREVASVAIGE